MVGDAKLGRFINIRQNNWAAYKNYIECWLYYMSQLIALNLGSTNTYFIRLLELNNQAWLVYVSASCNTNDIRQIYVK